MSEKYYVGLNVTNFEDVKKTLPVSRITLNVDSDHSITAGDDSGLEIVSDCAHATQAMANAILARMKGYQYQAYTADAADLDPAAEPGDGVTFDGIYGMISNFSDDGSGFPGISAPGEMELEDEFPTQGGPLTKMFSRKISDTNSRLTKTADEIRADVSSEIEGLSTSFSVKLDAITGRVETAEGDIGTLKLTAGTLESTLKTAQGDITSLTARAGSLETSMKNAQGDITTLKSTTSGLETTVKSHDGRITTAQQTADKIGWVVKSGTTASNFEMTDRAISLVSGTLKLSATNGTSSSTLTLKSGSTELASASITFSGLVNFVNKSDIYSSGTTTIDGGKITTGSITGNQIKASSIGADKLSVSSLEAIVAKIGGFNIGASSIYNGLSSLTGSADGVYLGTDGIALGGGKFKVTKAGALTATNADITGKITANSGSFSGTVNATSGKFTGEINATSGTFTGTVNAKSGSFGSLTVTQNSLGTSYTTGSFGGLSVSSLYPTTTGGTFSGGLYNVTGTLNGVTGSYSGSINSGGTFSGGLDGVTGSLSSYYGVSGLFTGTNSGSLTGTASSATLSSCSLGATTLSTGNGNAYFNAYSVGTAQVYGGTQVRLSGPGTTVTLYSNQLNCSNSIVAHGSITCDGEKPRTMTTEHFGKRQLDAYESPNPTFSDFGTAKLDESGVCYIVIDPIFAETVNQDYFPIVFLTKYASGDIWVQEVSHDMVMVSGTPGLAFAWETRYEQGNCDQGRLRVFEQRDESYSAVREFGDEEAVDYEPQKAAVLLSVQSYLQEEKSRSTDYGKIGCEYYETFERSLTES